MLCQKSAKSILSICVALSVALKSFALHSYFPNRAVVPLLIALIASVGEMLVYVVIMVNEMAQFHLKLVSVTEYYCTFKVLSIWCLPSGMGRQLLSNVASNSRPHWTLSPLYVKIYLAIVGPELLKGVSFNFCT